MLEVKHTQVAFLGRAIKATNNAYNIGEIDTRLAGLDFIEQEYFEDINEDEGVKSFIKPYVIKLGSNTDHHQSHDSWLRGVRVCADVKYPRYISPEMQRYHFFEIISSQSTMHTLLKVMKRDNYVSFFNKMTDEDTIHNLHNIVFHYNELVIKNENEKDEEAREIRSKEIEKIFHKIKSNLPEGYELWMTIETNYLQLKTMLVQRNGHRLNDWKPFIEWIHSLPLFDYLTQKDNTTTDN